MLLQDPLRRRFLQTDNTTTGGSNTVIAISFFNLTNMASVSNFSIGVTVASGGRVYAQDNSSLAAQVQNVSSQCNDTNCIACSEYNSSQCLQCNSSSQYPLL